MKKTCFLLAACVLLLSGCYDQQYSASVAGAGVGGMFGSAVGGIFGGPRGSHVGTVVGAVAGGMVGAAASAPERRKSASGSDDDYYGARSTGDVSYSRARSYADNSLHWQVLEVGNVEFSDQNENRALDAGEEAFITFEIYNRGDRTLYDVAPRLTCSDRHVRISPTAIISSLPPNKGVRYKAAVLAGRKLKPGTVMFTVSFGENRNAHVAKNFRINTRR